MPAAIAEDDLANWRECRDCGLFQRLPEIPDGEAAMCARCNSLIRRAAIDSIPFARICAVIAASLFVLALFVPLVQLNVLGRFSSSTVFSGPQKLRDHGLATLGVVIFMTLVVMPGVKLALELVVLFGVRARHTPHWLPYIFGWLEHVSPWAMVEVFMLGSFVAYTRLKALAHVDIGPALFALGGVMLTMVATDATLDREAIWEELETKTAHLKRTDGDDRSGEGIIGCDVCGRVDRARVGDKCVRCGHPLKVRQGNIGSVWALLITAALIYIPANTLPVMNVIKAGQGGPTTILNGVVELAKNNLWPLALLVLVASIIVPIFKLVSLVTMLVMMHGRSTKRLGARAKLFRLVKFIGRWSMIDIFMLSVLVGVVRFGRLADVTPGMGAVAFCGVVIITMAATEFFDPRRMWDAAGRAEKAYETGGSDS